MGQRPLKWHATPARPAHHDIGQATGVFGVLVVTIVLLWRQNALLLLLISIAAMVALRLWHERYDMVFFLVLAILGTLAEIVFVQSGVWHYANPTWLGIPSWFPLSFGTAGLAGERLAASLATVWSERAAAQEPDR